jgi:hypothetical protein
MPKDKTAKPIANIQLVNDACAIIEQAQKSAYHAVNEMLVKRNWLLGMRIQKEVLKDKRAGYGDLVISALSKKLTHRYGRGFNKSNLYMFVQFFVDYPQIFQSVIGKSGQKQLEFMPTRPIALAWTHYSILLQEKDANARSWYEQEAVREVWSTRTLQRNISSQYYHRMLKSQHKDLVHKEMIKKNNSIARQAGIYQEPRHR